MIDVKGRGETPFGALCSLGRSAAPLDEHDMSVLRALVTLGDKKAPDRCHRPMATIADVARLSTRKAWTVIHRLSTLGLVGITKTRNAAGHQGPSIYRLRLDAMDAMAEQHQRPKSLALEEPAAAEKPAPVSGVRLLADATGPEASSHALQPGEDAPDCTQDRARLHGSPNQVAHRADDQTSDLTHKRTRERARSRADACASTPVTLHVDSAIPPGFDALAAKVLAERKLEHVMGREFVRKVVWPKFVGWAFETNGGRFPTEKSMALRWQRWLRDERAPAPNTRPSPAWKPSPEEKEAQREREARATIAAGRAAAAVTPDAPLHERRKNAA